MGRKKLRRKLGKKVLSGATTVDEARARLGRKVSQKAAYKSAWSGWPEQPPGYEPRVPDEEYVLEAARWRPSPPALPKRKRSPARPQVAKSYGAQLGETLAEIAAIPDEKSVLSRYGHVPPPQPAVVKQLTGPERAMVAALQRQLELAGYDPARREDISAKIARITGPTFT
jgi:hypothetical protein